MLVLNVMGEFVFFKDSKRDLCRSWWVEGELHLPAAESRLSVPLGSGLGTLRQPWQEPTRTCLLCWKPQRGGRAASLESQVQSEIF